MRRLRVILGSNWTASIVVGVCILVLSDADTWLPRMNRTLEVLYEMSPVGDALLTVFALGGLLFFGSALIRSVVRWFRSKRRAFARLKQAEIDEYRDLQNFGPQRRALKKLSSIVNQCKAEMIHIHDFGSFMDVSGDILSRRTQLADNLRILAGQLLTFGVQDPKSFPIVNTADQRRMITFLAQLEGIVERGEIEVIDQLKWPEGS